MIDDEVVMRCSRPHLPDEPSEAGLDAYRRAYGGYSLTAADTDGRVRDALRAFLAAERAQVGN